MKTYLTLALLPIAGCAPKAIPVANVAPAPRPVEAVAPAARQAREDSLRAGEASSRLEGKVAELQRTTGELRAGMSGATQEADRLRKQKTATEKELDGLWQLLTASDEHAKRLFAEVEQAKAFADEQNRLRLIADRRSVELVTMAAMKDQEVLELRTENDFLRAELEVAKRSQETLTAQKDAAEKQAAVGNYLRKWLIGIVAAVVLYFLLKLALRFVPPPSLTRFLP